MRFLAEIVADVKQHLGELQRVFTTCKRLILRFLHLGRSDKLHRASDLRGVFDRLDASADVAEVCHVIERVESRIQNQGRR